MKTIKMKYDIGTKVWVVYALHGEVSVYEDTLAEFCISEEKEFYITNNGFHELTQDEVILYDDKDKLHKVICKKMNEIKKLESQYKVSEKNEDTEGR